jgi:N-acetylglutamate synthase-like GNAT family acetyltransferase
MNDSGYQVKTIETVAELERVYAFAVSILGELDPTGHSLDFYRKHFSITPSLLICVKRAGIVIGCALGSIDEDHILVGPTAVAAGEREQGIGSAMMRRLEEEAQKLGQTTLILGALREAESFYLRCGYRPNLFIQLPEAGQVEKLKQLNQKYPVIWESSEGKWTRLMLATPQVDRALQAAYAQQFPACHTQYVFIKEIG